MFVISSSDDKNTHIFNLFHIKNVKKVLKQRKVK